MPATLPAGRQRLAYALQIHHYIDAMGSKFT